MRLFKFGEDKVEVWYTFNEALLLSINYSGDKDVGDTIISNARVASGLGDMQFVATTTLDTDEEYYKVAFWLGDENE